MQFTAKEIAKIIDGEVVGNENIIVNKFSKIQEGEEGSLCFIDNPQYNKYLKTSSASVIIINNELSIDFHLNGKKALIRVENPRLAIAKLLDIYSNQLHDKSGIMPSARISNLAKIGNNVFIGEHTYIGDNVVIGDNVKIHHGCIIEEGAVIHDNTIVYSRVTVGRDCVVGKNCIIQPGVIIGSDGFGFVPNSENNYQKVVHIGNVIIEDNVEIGANTTIDRGSLGATIIRKGVKLDNLIQIAHNVEIGENTVIAAQTGIAGSTKIGKNCMIGGQVGIVGHISIADEVKIAAQSGVGNSITKKGAVVQGSPAMEITNFKKSYVLFKKLPELFQQIQRLTNEKK